MVKKAILITFSVKSKKFESNYERNKFFKALYGWTQTVPKDNKKYTYRRPGLLDEIKHKKIDQSSFIIPEDNFDQIIEFFEEWADKVIWKNFKILLDKELEEFFEEV